MLRKIIIGCHILGLSTVFAYSQNKLYVNFKAGNQTEQPLDNVKTISFPGSVFKVNKKNGSSESTPFTSIKFVKFDKPFATGLAENESAISGSVYVYPNPFTGNKINLGYNLKTAGLVSIEIMNMDGLVRYSYNESGVSGNNKTQLSISDLPSGIYICQIKTADKALSAKIIKY